jgi:hypothetical protein
MKKRLTKIFSNPDYPEAMAFGISCCIHLLIALSLALILIAVQPTGLNSIRLSLADMGATNETNSPILIQSETQKESEPTIENPTISMESLRAEIKIDANPKLQGNTGEVNSSLSSQIQLAAATSGSEEKSKPAGSKSTANFFGAEAYGNRFVFVIDQSSSMIGPRWEALCGELLRALRGLSEDQEFFIISFDSTAHAMLNDPPPKGKFLHPTTKNVKKIHHWLRSIRHGSDTRPASAIGIAMEMEPDAIFLLSDGEIKDNTIQELRVWNLIHDQRDDDPYEKVRIPIHTVLLHSEVGFGTLELIAHENSGTFTPVAARGR